MKGSIDHKEGKEKSKRNTAPGNNAKKNTPKPHDSTPRRAPSNNANNKPLFDTYATEVEIQEYKRQGQYLEGSLRVYPNKRKVGYVSVRGISCDVIIPDEVCRNRAFHGDSVGLLLLPVEQWPPINNDTPPAPDVPHADVNEKCNSTTQKLWNPKFEHIKRFGGAKPAVEVPESNEIERIIKERRLQPAAKVIYVDKRPRHDNITGSLIITCSLVTDAPLPANVSYVFFQPHDMRLPNSIVPRLQLPEAFLQQPATYANHIYIGDIDTTWPVTSKLPFAMNLRPMGEIGNIQAETNALLAQYDIDQAAYTPEMLAPLFELLKETHFDSFSQQVAWTIPEQEMRNRRDLRDLCIVTIDPSNAKDLDDAVHVIPLGNDIYEVGVHIADVSYFVQPGTALDEEAKRRATSTYLVQKVIPMLPPVLCEELCSLNPNVDRLAFSCIFKLHADGKLVEEEPWFGRTVIRSCAKLDYATAQRMIDGTIPSRPSPGSNPDAFLQSMPEEVWEQRRRPIGHAAHVVARNVCLLHRIGMARRKERLSYGALTLNCPKIIFSLDGNGNPTSASTYMIRESNQLIEEYMLLANYLVAEKCIMGVGNMAFLRRHPPPDIKGLAELVAVSEELGISINTSSAHTLQQSLSVITQHTNKLLTQALTVLIMKPMSTAEYFTIDDTSYETWAHYALAIPYYTHFTSPIRRYADVVVHRLLELSLQSSETVREAISTEKIKELCAVATNCNERKMAAKRAQERSDEVFFAVYLMNNPIVAEAVVIGIGEKSFSVLVPAYSVSDRIFIDKMEGVTSEYSEETHVLKLISSQKIGSREFTNIDIKMMDKVRVKLSASTKPVLSVCIELIEKLQIDGSLGIEGLSLKST